MGGVLILLRRKRLFLDNSESRIGPKKLSRGVKGNSPGQKVNSPVHVIGDPRN
jgi:hypothetical protein